MKPVLRLTLALLVWLSAAPRVHAFSDFDRFAHAPELGGGGGRYFTGSPRDGFSCKVCHEGGPAPALRFEGLPLEGYEPNNTYDISVRWPEGEMPYALHLEVMGRDGTEGPKLILPIDTAIGASGRCGLVADERVATTLPEVEGRELLVVEACGATSARFLLTAPADPDFTLTAGVVSSDKSATAQGDGAAEITYVLRRVDNGQQVSGTSCALHPGLGRGWLGVGAVFGLLGLLSARRRQRR